MEPVLQVALDFADLERALRLAREAVGGGADWIEIGTPLIKSEGLDAVRRFRAEFPRQTLVADMKTMDAGRAEMEMAAKAGANVAIVLGVADDGTIRECIEAGRNQGLRVGVDLIRTADPARRAEQAREWGADHVIVHCGIDEQMRGGTPFDMLRKIAGRVDLPLAAAGGLNSETVADAVEAGARILIVGGAITKSPDAQAATRQIAEAMRSRARVATDLFKRSSPERLRETLLKVSTANLSDGAHRCPCMEGIRPVMTGLKMAGAGRHGPDVARRLVQAGPGD